jgi:hypothetical protein
MAAGPFAALGAPWRRLADGLPLVLPAIAVAAVCWLLASLLSNGSSFSVQARTDVLRMQLACDETVVWDLPSGQAWALRGSAVPAGDRAAAPVNVTLRGGTQAWVRADPQAGGWLMRFEPSPAFACGPGAKDQIVVNVDHKPLAAGEGGYAYRSAPSGHAALLLRGRVLLGAEIQFGAGLPGGVAAPLLHSGRIVVRTRDRATEQGLHIHAHP